MGVGTPDQLRQLLAAIRLFRDAGGVAGGPGLLAGLLAGARGPQLAPGDRHFRDARQGALRHPQLGRLGILGLHAGRRRIQPRPRHQPGVPHLRHAVVAADDCLPRRRQDAVQRADPCGHAQEDVDHRQPRGRRKLGRRDRRNHARAGRDGDRLYSRLPGACLQLDAAGDRRHRHGRHDQRRASQERFGALRGLRRRCRPPRHVDGQLPRRRQRDRRRQRPAERPDRQQRRHDAQRRRQRRHAAWIRRRRRPARRGRQ